MTADPLVLLVDLDQATTRLLATAQRLTDPGAPSLLPGWTRGHVLSHLSHNADALNNLVTWARTGVVTPAYPSRTARATDIEADAGRPLAELIGWVRDSSARFADALAALPVEAWSVEVEMPSGAFPAAALPWRRLQEVEVHHVDLGAGYQPADWPASFSHRLLHEAAHGLPGAALTLAPTGLGHPLPVGVGGPPVISGPPHALAAWLCGRSPGDDLAIDPNGALPALPKWM